MNANNYTNLKLRGLKRKYELITLRGGKCEICGYDKNISALEFHHKNPEEKEFQLDARHLSNNNLEKIKSEFDKCILLCSNCHRELHNPELGLNQIPSLIESCNKKSISNENDYGLICPVCGTKFRKMKGKIYCSSECREKDKHYPTYEELLQKYQEVKSWEKVAKSFNITRKIILTIRKKNE